MPDFEDRLADLLALVRSNITEYGWHLNAVFPTRAEVDNEDAVPWVYTTGLLGKGLPELIAVVDHSQAWLMNQLAQAQVDQGMAFGHGQRITEQFQNGYDPIAIKVDDPTDQTHCPQSITRAIYSRNEFPSMQVVIPDKNHKYPWQDGYNHEGQPQPLLGQPPQEDA